MEEQEQEEWEEEEQLVVAELSGVIDSEALRRWDGWCKVVGLDSEQPVLQLGRYVFAGEYEDAVGTCVIFQEEANAREDPASTPAFRYETSYVFLLRFVWDHVLLENEIRISIKVVSRGKHEVLYMCHTAKKLMLQRTFLSETKEGEARSQGIELLSLNEGDVCGRSGMVCHYTLDPKELERVKAEAEDQGPGVSDESDTETAATEHSMLDVTESTENAEQGAESTIAESEQENY